MIWYVSGSRLPFTCTNLGHVTSCPFTINLIVDDLYSSSCPIVYTASSPAVDGSIVISLFGSSGVFIFACCPFIVTIAASPASPLAILEAPFTVKLIGTPRLGNSWSFGKPACKAASTIVSLLLSYNLSLSPLNLTIMKLFLCS